MDASRRASLFFAVLSLSTPALACVSTMQPPPDDITGAWHGTYRDRSGNTGTIDATFTQTGSILGGSMVLT